MTGVHPRAHRHGHTVISANDESGERVIVGGTDILEATREEDLGSVLVAHVDWPAERVLVEYDQILTQINTQRYAAVDGETQRTN